MSRESLGHFELLVLLALLRVGDEAYGVPIAQAIEQSSSKRVMRVPERPSLARTAWSDCLPLIQKLQVADLSRENRT
jgi:hypothetical protein